MYIVCDVCCSYFTFQSFKKQWDLTAFKRSYYNNKLHVFVRNKFMDHDNARQICFACAFFLFWSFPPKQLNILPKIRKPSYQCRLSLSNMQGMCAGVRNILYFVYKSKMIWVNTKKDIQFKRFTVSLGGFYGFTSNKY